MKNKLLKAGIAATLLLTLAACSSNKPSITITPELDAPISHIEGATKVSLTSKYDFLENSNHFETIGVENLKETFNDRGTAIVLIGTPKCHNCQSLMPEIQRAASKYNQTVYYIDISSTSAEDYDSLIEILNPYLSEDSDGNKSIYIPHILSIKEGKVIQSEIGYTQDFDYTNIMTFTDAKNNEEVK